jgi:hypothetical protein
MPSRSLLDIFRKVLQRISFAPLDVNCLHCLEYVSDDAREPVLLVEKIEVREGTPQDLKGLAECRNFPEGLPARFASNEHCVVATIGETVLGYQWFCDKPFRIEERYKYEVKIPFDALYGYDAFVRPEYRRARIWTIFHATYLRTLLARINRRRIIVMVDQGNTVSMAAHSRIGYRLYRKIYIIKLFGKSFCVPRALDSDRSKARAVQPLGTTGEYTAQAKNLIS